jgi:hypothetical protein
MRDAIRAAAMLLGVGPGATLEQVMAARREQAKRWHPDVNPSADAVVQMGRINRSCDLLCDVIRRGGLISGVPAPPAVPVRPPQRAPQARLFEILLESEEISTAVGVVVGAPDRYARLEISVLDAMQGGTRSVCFVRREPGTCTACAGLGSSPGGPKRVCRACGGGSLGCQVCQGRGWVHLAPGSCRHCDGSGAALVEHTIRLKLPPGIRAVRRALVRGWGDLNADGTAGNLWIDLVPSQTVVESAPWRFEYYGHNWPRPDGELRGEWFAIRNSPLPDEEMRELGFWRDPASAEWVRQAPTDGVPALLDVIRQRQFFVPQARSQA